VTDQASSPDGAEEVVGADETVEPTTAEAGPVPPAGRPRFREAAGRMDV